MFSPSQVFFLVLWLLLTSCRSLLLRISPSARPHGINQYSFLVYLLGLRNRVTVTFWTSLLSVNLSAYHAFVPSFCSSGYDFAIPSSRLHLTMQTLGVAFGLVGNYLPADFHRRALICPSYAKRAQANTTLTLFLLRRATKIKESFSGCHRLEIAIAIILKIHLLKLHRYMHSVFHIFVVAGSILQFFGIFFYVI